PDMEGWRVLRRMKLDPQVRHIPIYVVSSSDGLEHSLRAGAHGFLQKPIQTTEVFRQFLQTVGDFVDRRERRVVVLEADEQRRNQLYDLLASKSVEVVATATGAATIDAVASGDVDCVVLT